MDLLLYNSRYKIKMCEMIADLRLDKAKRVRIRLI